MIIYLIFLFETLALYLTFAFARNYETLIDDISGCITGLRSDYLFGRVPLTHRNCGRF
jgi:hypothetical protein